MTVDESATVPATSRWSRVRAMRVVRLGAVIVVLVLAAVAVVVTVVIAGPPSKQDLIEQAGLIGKRQLLIGVKDDQPGISLLDPKTQKYTGFDIDIAYMIAGDLGFQPHEVRFLSLESEDRERMQGRDGNQYVVVDLVVASFSITAEREAQPGVTFSAPYLQSEQSVITRKDYQGQVESLSDLVGKKVCTLATSTSDSALGRAGVAATANKRASECVTGLFGGTYDAVSTDAAILAGFVALYPDKLKHFDIGLSASEWWGVNTGTNEALRQLVNLTLWDSRNDPGDRRWENAFDTHLRPVQAVNLPQQVAVDRQPEVEEVNIRRWPWESGS